MTSQAQREDARLAQAAQAERAGLTALQTGLYVQAEKHFRRALALNPEHHLGYGQLGLALFHQGHLTEAAEALDVAVAALPADDALHRTYGMVLEALERPAEALGYYSTSAMLNPRSPLAHATLGRLALRIGDLDLAEEYLLRAVALDGEDAALHGDIATLWERRDNPTKAVEALQLGARLSPRDPDLHHRLGLALEGKGDLKGARAALATAQALRPTDRHLIEALARVLLLLGATSEVIALYARAVARDPAQRGMYASQMSRLMSGRPVPQAAPTSASRAAAVASDDESRIAQLERALEAEPGNARLRSQLSIMYLKLGRLDDAKQQMRMAEAARRQGMTGVA